MPEVTINVPIHDIDRSKPEKEEKNAEDDDDCPTNVVNIHDPFFLWCLFEHSDRALIRSLATLSEADCSRLYWTCHYHKHTKVCQQLLDNYSHIRIAHDAIEKISTMTKAVDGKTPDLSEIPIPFLLPTSPEFIVTELRDGSFIPSKGKPLKFTVVDREENTKT
jgi:hypothetical protein